MTTRSRESLTPGKEKRGTSPSSTPTTQRRRSPSTSKPSSPSRTTHHDASSEPDKHIPNYLRPTLSSAPDVSKQQAKKPVSTSETKLMRRRSFDHPPTSSSPSGTQKSRGSPSPTLRSSSFSGKSVPSQRGVPDKNVKGLKDVVGKQHSLYARPVSSTVKKGSGINIKKKEGASVSSSTTKEHVTSPPHEKVDNHPDLSDDVSDPETKHQESCIAESADDVSEPETKNQESCISEAEEESLQIGDGNHEKGSEDLVAEDQDSVNIEQSEGEGDDKDAKIATVSSPADTENRDAKVESVEFSTVPEHHQDVSLGIKTEEPENESHAEEEISSKQEELNEHTESHTEDEISGKQEERKEHSVNEMNHIISNDETVAGNNHNDEIDEKKGEEQEQEHEEKEEQTEDQATIASNKKEAEEEKEEEAAIASNKKEAEEEKEDEAAIPSDNKEAEASGGEAHESKEAEVEQVVVQDKQEPENPAPKVHIMAHGKKEIAVSNDHIEETASKLREQRKNKVKALAGAFESVISLQDK